MSKQEQLITLSENIKVSQPFLLGESAFISKVIPKLHMYYYESYILLDGTTYWHMMSNAVYQGGLKKASAIINYRVPLDYNSENPMQDIEGMIKEAHVDTDSTVAFMTAANLSKAAICEYQSQHFAISVLATAGVTNAARAGAERKMYEIYEAGTINLFIWIDGRMSQAAMVNAIMTATEAKAAALADLEIIELSNGKIATGTTSDGICLAVNQNSSYSFQHGYAGTATLLGGRLAQVVYTAIYCSVHSVQP